MSESASSQSIDQFFTSHTTVCNQLTAIYNLSEAAFLFGNPIVAKRLDDIALHISNSLDVMVESYKKALDDRYNDANQSSKTLLELAMGMGAILDNTKKDSQ